MNKKTTILSYAGLFLITAIWGYAFVVVKNSIDSVPPIYMLAIRFTIASVGLIIVFHRKLKAIDKKYIKAGTLIGLALFLAYLVQTIGIKYTTAGKNAFLTTAYVIIVPFIHLLAYRKNPGKYSFIAAFIAIVGIGLLTLNNDFSVNIGDALSFACGIGYAVHIVLVDKYTEDRDPILLSVIQLTAAAVFSWIAAPFIGGSFPQAVFSTDNVVSMLYLGLFSTMIALLLQNVCQKHTSPSTTSLIMSLEAVFGTGFSVILLNEQLSSKAIAGCVLILFAVILSETKLSFLHRKKE